MHIHLHSVRKPLERAAGFTLSAALLLGSIPAYAVDDGVNPTYDEAYYAMTDYYGNLTDGSVVKSYTTNGSDTLTDYGEYDEIVNLTDGTAPSTAGGKSVFTFAKDAIPEHFYFEGKTTRPFEQLPWTLSVHYTLNGVPTRAEDLAGKTGVVEISVDAIPNEDASEYARNNYTLEAMAIFNQDDILSLEAPGAQVQLIGNLRAVLFIGLPGEECHFSIRVGSNDFSFGGMTLLMVPATLSQLQEISKLSERKDDLEENYNKLSDSLDVLLDSMSGISGSLYNTANGLDKLNEARGTISDGKGSVYDAADAVQGDLDAISAVLEPVSGQIDDASAAISDSKAVLSKLTEETTSLRSDLKTLESLIDEVQDHDDDLNDLVRRIIAMRSDLLDLESALNSAKNTSIATIAPLFNGMSASELESALSQAESLHQAYAAGNSGHALTFEQFITSALLAGGKSASLSSSIYAAYTGYTAAGCTSKEQVYQAALAAGSSEEEAQQTAAAWETGAAMQQAFATAGGTDMTPLDFEHFLYAALLLTPQYAASAKSTSASLYKLWSINDADPALTKVLILEADDLNAKVGEINGVIGKTNTLIKGIAAPTAELAGDLAALCKSLDELDDLLDTAYDFGNLGRSVSQKCTSILDQVEALYKVLDTYEPKLQDGLSTAKSLTETARKTVLDTSTFLTSFEDLLKKSGEQLDVGTKETLDGLAAALRATARSLSTTGDVKAAKNNIGDIIEDTWNEYTGDINNLLLMDANAEAVSLTDERNGSPQSIQVLIRTQEIKADDGATSDIAVEEAAQTTFWGRVAQMFKDFWAAITGIFKGKD